jgi:hypothetical protein
MNNYTIILLCPFVNVADVGGNRMKAKGSFIRGLWG